MLNSTTLQKQRCRQSLRKTCIFGAIQQTKFLFHVVRALAKVPIFNPKSVLILLKQVRPQHTAVEEITNLGQKERAYPWELRIWACEGAQLLSFWPFYQTGRLLPSCCCCSSHRCTVLPRWSKNNNLDLWYTRWLWFLSSVPKRGPPISIEILIETGKNNRMKMFVGPLFLIKGFEWLRSWGSTH